VSDVIDHGVSSQLYDKIAAERDAALIELADRKQFDAKISALIQELQDSYESLRHDLYVALDLFGAGAPADFSDRSMTSQVGSMRLQVIDLIRKLDEKRAADELPIRMLLECPNCFERHIDEGEWATRPHKIHECQACGHQFKVCDRPTVGVKFLVER